MTIEIPLTQGKVALIDDADLPLVARYKWHVHKVRKVNVTKWYAATAARKPDGNQTQLLMHRLILGANVGELTDHGDGDGLNNRRLNIRLCTIHDNNRNRHQVTGSNQYRGVFYDKRSRRWYARIRLNNRSKGLGGHPTPESAAKSYDNAAKEHYGDFAVLNFG